MTRYHPGFYRSPSIQWDWPDSESNRLSLIRLFATRRIVVAGGLEPPVSLCRRVTVCCRRRWATPPVHRFCPSRCDAYRARFICTRRPWVCTSSWEMDQGRGAAENRTRVWPAVNHCLPSRAYPTLDAHPWTGAFGEPARLVDDVRMLAGRIHRPTVRPVRFEVLRL